jgi:hypothetical protein
MSRWTDEELRELVTLWLTNSAPQIAERLHRQHAAICRKAMRPGLCRPIFPNIFTSICESRGRG